MMDNNITPDQEYTQDETEFTAQQEVREFTRNAKANIPNSMCPKPPKPGEIMMCSICNAPMLPEHFSKDPYKRKIEFKWHTHWYCREQTLNLCDRNTPGLMAERARMNK